MKSKVSLIIILLFIIPIFPQNDIRILQSNSNTLIVEYTPAYTDSVYKEINGQKFLDLYMAGGQFDGSLQPGQPAVPTRTINAGVPAEAGNTIQIISSSYTDIQGRLAPLPVMKPDNGMPAYEYRITEEYSDYKAGDDLVEFGESGYSRGLYIQGLTIKPVKYYPQENRIRLYNKIVFRIDIASSGSGSGGGDDVLLKDAVINYDAAKRWIKKRTAAEKQAVFNSVLANGSWYRFDISEEGFYKITYQMLPAFGIDPSKVDPRTIKIYNNGGAPIPERVSAPVNLDLTENAITVTGEEDGVFNENDYIIFYGRGINFWEYSAQENSVVRRFNPYSLSNVYWITSGGNNGKRMERKVSAGGGDGFIQSSTNAYASLEEDKVNLPKSGRHFMGDEFTQMNRSKVYMNKLDGRISGQPIRYNFRFVNSAYPPVRLAIEENGNAVYSSFLPGRSSQSNSEYSTGNAASSSFVSNNELTDGRSNLKFTFDLSDPAAQGYLDWFEIIYSRNLTAADDKLILYSKDTTSVIEYHLNGFSHTDIRVFDVSDFANVKEITDPLMLSGGEFRFRAAEEAGKVSKYFALCTTKFLTPVNPVKAENSNLHGEAAGAEYLIIYPKEFREQAERLKEYRANQADIKISGYTADIDAVINEFGGGIKDPAAVRNYIKYAYENWSVKPLYVLLFGDGNYDYRNLEGYGKNFILTYQTEESLHHISSYTSDDFFVKVEGDDNRVDLGIGRIPAQSIEDAGAVVDKIIYYEQSADAGLWRNLITLVSDDGKTSTGDDGSEHTRPSENLTNSYIPGSYEIKKIYLAAYPTELTSAGRRKPAVNNEIIETINEGTLILNYIGHGNPEVWAHENVWENTVSLSQLKNDKYFFLTAATCDFGYYDLTSKQSGAELMVLKRNSGAVAAFSSARLVYSGYNHQLMYTLFDTLLNNNRDQNNNLIPLGRVSYLVKQKHNIQNDEKYHLLGDPALRLKMPRYQAVIDSVNGVNPAGGVQLKALSKTTIKGRVLKPDGSTWNDFSGEGIITVYDSQRRDSLEEIRLNINVQGGVIFRGRISVVNGSYNAEFVVPKDISYEEQNGKVIFYFYGNAADGIGFTKDVFVNGTDSGSVNDGKGPEIEIFFDDTQYANATLIRPDSKLIVKLSDETGLNTTGTGVGHKLEGILNDRNNEPIDFTNYFTGDLDAGGRSGEVNYPFNNLASGSYKLEVKAWDVYNNYSAETVYFNVDDGDGLTIRDVLNYPNPFVSNTTFTFQQNLNRVIDVNVKVYTVAGRLIRDIESRNMNERFVKIDWDGRDEDGNMIGNGVYLYKIIVKTADGEFSKSVLGKLAVVR